MGIGQRQTEAKQEEKQNTLVKGALVEPTTDLTDLSHLTHSPTRHAKIQRQP